MKEGNKIKKLIMSFLIFGMMFSHLTPTFAMESTEENSNPDIDEILKKEASEEEINAVGQSIADEQNEISNKSRTTGELWTYVSKSQVYSRRAIKGKYKTKIQKNTSATYSVTVSLASQFKYTYNSTSSITVNGGISATKSATLKGPNGQKLSNGKVADYRIFIGITFGEIYKFKYKVTDKYSGALLRYEYKNSVVSPETFGLNHLMVVNSNGSITVGNKENTKTKNYSNFSAYQSALEAYSYTCKNVIYF